MDFRSPHRISNSLYLLVELFPMGVALNISTGGLGHMKYIKEQQAWQNQEIVAIVIESQHIMLIKGKSQQKG